MRHPRTLRRAATGLLAAALILPIGLFAWKAYFAAPEVVDVRGGARGATIGAVHYGGPDRPAGALRALLLRRVRATPPGQSIDWATYYFLDAELAHALTDASDRGVRVRLVVEGNPRLEDANGAVLEQLRRHGLRGGLTIRPEARFPFRAIGGKLHAKIYAFSWPRPLALVGSFNPSGGGSASAATIDEIGDQDRGHNLLVEIVSPGLVRRLVAHVAALAAGGGAVGRFSPENNRIWRDRDTDLFFYPRLRPDIIERAIDRLGRGDHLWAAVSHLKNESVGNLVDAAKRGAALELVVHDTERRVPQRTVARLAAAGVVVRRFRHPEGLPMHAKFFVLEAGGRREAYFGSLNYNRNSRLLNDEVLVRSSDPALVASLLRRFVELDAQRPAARAERRPGR